MTLMNRMRYAVTLLTVLVLFSTGCDTGLGPPDAPSGFSGVIRFKHWPPADSVWELRIVAFPSYPSDSASILLDLAQRLVSVYPQIGQPNLLSDTTQKVLFADSIRYSFTSEGTTLDVGVYNYVAFAWRPTANLFDWRPAGVYSTGPGQFDPAPVRVLLHKNVTGINIDVDFSNPPPKPWR
jgi:hypothetical protein